MTTLTFSGWQMFTLGIFTGVIGFILFIVVLAIIAKGGKK